MFRCVTHNSVSIGVSLEELRLGPLSLSISPICTLCRPMNLVDLSGPEICLQHCHLHGMQHILSTQTRWSIWHAAAWAYCCHPPARITCDTSPTFWMVHICPSSSYYQLSTIVWACSGQSAGWLHWGQARRVSWRWKGQASWRWEARWHQWVSRNLIGKLEGWSKSVTIRSSDRP